ncbi:MAG TPA: twin-arginine translocase subunit TatC [Mycobacteriales bacterium]|nr:twin-arginine translocase subunit TatC [Mycobacteriales bacterium]
MTLTEHLRELRRRVIISAAAIVVATIVAFAFHHWLLHLITRPYCELPESYRAIKGRCTLVVGGVLDPFTVTLRLSLYAGLLLSCPVWLWQLWRFITPGLYDNERKWTLGFVGASVGLFAAGAVVAYITLQNGLRFLLGFATGGIASLLQFDSYLSYVVAMVLVFALSFEFPLLVVMLNLVGVVTFERLRRWTRGIIFGVFVFAAFATPSQDPFTMTALAVPICLLFGLSLLFAYVHDRRVAGRGDTSPYAHLGDDELSPIDDEPAVQA